MIDHDVRVGPSEADLQRDGRVARTMAGVAAGAVAVARPVAGTIARADRPAVKAAGRGKGASAPVYEAGDGGANGFQTMAPSGSKTLALTLWDGDWRHVDSCAPKRATRPEAELLPHELETRTGPDRTRRYCVADPNELLFGGGMESVPRHGDKLKDEMAAANPQPPGVRPFGRSAGGIHTFRTMTGGIIATRDSNGFLEAAQDLPRLPAGELYRLNIALPAGALASGKPGIL